MQAKADSAALMIAGLKAELAAMTDAHLADSEKLQQQLTNVRAEAAEEIKFITAQLTTVTCSADSAQADARKLSQQLADSQADAESAAQELLAVKAQLIASDNKSDSAAESIKQLQQQLTHAQADAQAAHQVVLAKRDSANVILQQRVSFAQFADWNLIEKMLVLITC